MCIRDSSGIVEGIVARDFREAWKWDSIHLNRAKKEMRRQLRKMGDSG